MSRQSAKEGTVPLPFRGKQTENCSHNLGKSLGEGLGDKFLYRRKDGKTEFFVRCRRTYLLNKIVLHAKMTMVYVEFGHHF